MAGPGAFKNAKRIVVMVLGGTVVLIGLALLLVPGPGLLVIFAGLALLGTEFVWARRLLSTAREQAKKVQRRMTEGRPSV